MKWPREKYIRWIGIPLLGFVISFITNDKSHQKLGMISNVTISIIFTAILWNGVYFIIMFYRRKYSSVEFTAKRLVISAILSALFLIVGANVIRLVMGLVTLKELTSLREILHYAHVNIVAGILVSSIYEGTYFFGKWKESVQLNEELKNQQIRTQFEVLQNQMSPHFLFNSLNTLTTLIAENPEIAIDFTQTLSEVYRYILQNKEKQLVTLSEELAFSESYLYLQKMRYPDNLNFSCTINSTQKDLSIPPLTLQMLIENAIKHNVVSKKMPLYIEVGVKENELLFVKNNLQLKKTLEKSTKTGLENIKKRFAFFGDNEISIAQSDGSFSVTLPLIKVEQA